MNILVLNASPKGNNQVTLYTSLYLQELHKEHTFTFLNVGQRIKNYEKDFAPVKNALEEAELVIFQYPVYTFIAPYQLHRLIELIKESGVNLTGKYASQITTSKHFYDVTAHRFIEENCYDLGMKVVRGLQADMEDLLSKEGQKQAQDYFEQLIFSCENDQLVVPPVYPPHRDTEKQIYTPVLKEVADSDFDTTKDIVIVTNYSESDTNLKNMILDFQRSLTYHSRVINIREFPFGGGCLGCFGCAVTGKCVYKDGFDEYLRKEIQQADAIVYAFTIENHYTHSQFKCYDDRQFCNGHRTVTHGTPVAYLISGDYTYEPNLRMILEARSEVGGNYLVGVATDEISKQHTTDSIQTIAEGLELAIENKFQRPANFYGVGGMKIFRDLIYTMQGMMKADHKFYKQKGLYDFPQKNKKKILAMKAIGFLTSIPQVQKEIKGNMTKYIVQPYEKVVLNAQNDKKK